MMLKVKSVNYDHDYMLLVELSDGALGYFDVMPYLDKGIFTELTNIDYLKRVTVNVCGICWPGGQDFSADTLAYELQQSPTSALSRHGG